MAVPLLFYSINAIVCIAVGSAKAMEADMVCEMVLKNKNVA